jgi:arginine N-succinyltransferase
MLIIRPVRSGDLEELVRLAESAGIGLTTLPKDRRLLRQRITASEHALAMEVLRPGGEQYLFVLEDLTTGRLAGTCGFIAKVGGFEPFYSYALQTTLHESKAYGIRKEVQVLHLVANHSGPTEIGTLFLASDYRGGGTGRLLSLSRFLFMATFPGRFEAEVIAEMRGVLDAEGRSPFWQAIGQHFFDMPFARADLLSAADKQFIADLMPKHPIYIPMLPPEVQAVIGQVHDETRPALRLLEQEGFRFGGMVDIFDAGPLVRARRDDVRSITESRTATVGRILPLSGDHSTWLIANERLDYRCCLGHLEANADGTVGVPRDIALALGLKLGDPLRFVAARPREAQAAATKADSLRN